MTFAFAACCRERLRATEALWDSSYEHLLRRLQPRTLERAKLLTRVTCVSTPGHRPGFFFGPRLNTYANSEAGDAERPPHNFWRLFAQLRAVEYRPGASTGEEPQSGPGLVVVAREQTKTTWQPVEVLESGRDMLAVARIAIADRNDAGASHFALVAAIDDPGQRRHWAIALRSTLSA